MIPIMSSNLFLQFNNFKFESTADEHINKLPFSGICLFADKPSDAIPCGADKPVKFSREAIQNALDSFAGMGVNCRYNPWDCPEDALTGHDEHFKIGVVERAELEADGGVHIDGLLWKHDMYEVCFMIQNAKDSLGFSVEVFIEDMKDLGDCYEVEQFTFTGVSILYKNLAAFRTTQIAAQAKQMQKETDLMTKEELDAIVGKISEGFADLKASFGAVSEKLDALAAKEPVSVDFSAVTASIDALGEKLEAKEPVVPELKADNEPTPKTDGMQFAGKEDEVPKDTGWKAACEAIDNDASIPDNLKAHKKVVAYIASAKKSN